MKADCSSKLRVMQKQPLGISWCWYGQKTAVVIDVIWGRLLLLLLDFGGPKVPKTWFKFKANSRGPQLGCGDGRAWEGDQVPKPRGSCLSLSHLLAAIFGTFRPPKCRALAPPTSTNQLRPA